MINIYSEIALWTIALVFPRIEGVLEKMQNHASYSSNASENTKWYPLFAPTVPICSNLNVRNQPYICQLVNRLKNIPRISNKPSYMASEDYSINRPISRQGRSYYGSFGHGPPAAPSYYPTFDPISVLASLAFLAFLLQSFASLFDRSRSIIPTIVSSSRDSSGEIDENIEERVIRALDEYATLKSNFIDENKEVTTSKGEFSKK